MNTITFDTLQFANQLKQAIHNFHLDDIATKRDIRELELKIEVLKADTGRIIAETKADLTRWIIGAGFLQTTLIIGVLLKLAKLV